MRLLMLDNLDSFTFNLVLYLRELGASVAVKRSDDLDLHSALAHDIDGFVISPGPGRPEDAGRSKALVRACFDERKPLLGVCLGHQAIAAEFGARIEAAPQVMHGKTSTLVHHGSALFDGLPSPMTATRYHSLVVDGDTVPKELYVTAKAEDETIQGISHRDRPIHGVQFHPESIASEHGRALLRNFLRLVERCSREPAAP